MISRRNLSLLLLLLCFQIVFKHLRFLLDVVSHLDLLQFHLLRTVSPHLNHRRFVCRLQIRLLLAEVFVHILEKLNLVHK